MQPWEYLTMRYPTPAGASELNEFGSQGWELVAVMEGETHYYYYFKRPES
jgi:hypothetical protein